MKRTQVYLEEGLDRRLREAAREQGRSAASLVREAVGAYLESKGRRSPENPLLGLIGIGEGGPGDTAEEHDHYLYGAPKRS
ncbi:MAG: ribbon-helix-helix protein, CopG family [Acidobacteria bacterium]|nr:ribbon-helix-helix protein, CopG family [Acidobacteriota bacterium]